MSYKGTVNLDGARSFKVEVIADRSGEWCGNGVRWWTVEGAEAAGADLECRWTAVREYRVSGSDDEPNGKDKPVEPAATVADDLAALDAMGV